jgi:hypothetical protein
MNNLAYMGQDGQNVAAKVEELLRKELAAGGPITYQVETEGAAEVGVGSVLKDVATSLFGGKSTRLFTIRLHLTQPRSAELDVHMNQQGLGCVAGPLVYATVVSKRVGGEISLGNDGKFTGDADGAGKLNSRKDLLKKCAAFAMTEGGLAGAELKIPRTLKIVPQEGGAQIVGVTLPRSKSMGFSASLGSKEFFEIAAQIESTL